jgi:hypothetical protein
MWSFEHAVECDVPRQFAWDFWSNVSNWISVDSSLESVSLDGPFETGTRGRTKPSGQRELEWRLSSVDAPAAATIEIAAPGAVLRCAWSFEEQGARKTKLVQRLTIEGEQAEMYIEGIGPELTRTMPSGMANLAGEMVRNWVK